jgi:hypothetical protein
MRSRQLCPIENLCANLQRRCKHGFYLTATYFPVKQPMFLPTQAIGYLSRHEFTRGVMASAKKTLSARSKSGKGKTIQPGIGGVEAQGSKSMMDGVVLIDRRTSGERRKGGERRKANSPVVVERRQLDRRAKVNRRRQIDPTTCERNYTAEEIEFMKALDAYKRSSGRMFPTCSEILEVLRGLGYEKRSAMESQTPCPTEASSTSEPPLQLEHGVSA